MKGYEEMHKILFVCHGNICRSTMAEFVMKELVRQKGFSHEFYIASAATSREEIGNDTHWGTKEKLRQEGIPFTKRKAVQITKHDYDIYDYIIGFDRENDDEIRRICGPDTEKKVYSLLSFAGIDRDVADPWYTGNFDKTYKDVDTGCRALLNLLLKTL